MYMKKEALEGENVHNFVLLHMYVKFETQKRMFPCKFTIQCLLILPTSSQW